MKETIDTIQGCEITKEIDEGGFEQVEFLADADIDCDGSGGNPDGDIYFQPDTSLHFQGRALNASKVPYVVVPPIVILRTKGIVLGCRALVTNTRNGKETKAVVGDIGPTRKIGELSVECARRLGIASNPNTGGEESRIVHYQIYPGIPAVVDGIEYTLQHYQK